MENLEIKGTMLEEQETVIQWNHDTDYIRVFTSDPTFLTKLKKVVKGKDYEIERIGRQKGQDKTVQVKLSKSLFSAVIRAKKNLSDEERKIIAQRLKNSQKPQK